MALPDMSNVVASFGTPAVLKRATKTVGGHRPVNTYVETDITPVVQPAQHEDLNVDEIDYALQYLMVHSTGELEIGDRISWQSKEFKIIGLGDYNLYGYYESTAEEMKP